MDLSRYQVQEVFQSATLRERKRNLQRRMEEYILSELRNQTAGAGAAPVATDSELPCGQPEQPCNK